MDTGILTGPLRGRREKDGQKKAEGFPERKFSGRYDRPMKKLDGKPVMVYPCAWGYKVIGTDDSGLRSAIAATLQDVPHSVTPSNRSASGKYICLDVEMLVTSEDQRLTIYEGLRSHPAVKIVL
jgi:putative lipoic acid-binding regulatory protein